MENLIYLYGVIKALDDQSALPPMKGLDGQSGIYTLPADSIAAVVCELDAEEYAQEQLENKMKDPAWLHEKAFHHHETLLSINKNTTVIPMKFCTVYQGQERLMETISQHQSQMMDVLGNIADKEEWIIKVYCEADKVKETVTTENRRIEAKKEAISRLSPGRQYLEQRKLGLLIDEEMEKEKALFSQTLHYHFKRISARSEVKKNWQKNVTGREEEMCLNSVYMIEGAQVNTFLSKVKSEQEKWRDTGWIIEATGPWPSYHFSAIN